MTEIEVDDALMERVSAAAESHGYDDPTKYVEDVLHRQLDGVGGVGRP